MAIPKIIWQASNVKEQDIPDYIRPYAESWKKLNPDWDYRYLSDKQASDFIAEHYGEETRKIYETIQMGQLRGDLFRYLAIYQYGGLWADIDAKCLSPIEEWADLSKELVVSLSGCTSNNGSINQYCFLASSKNEFVGRIIEKCLKNIKNNKSAITVFDTFIPFVKGKLDILQPDKIQILEIDFKKSKDSGSDSAYVYHHFANDKWADMSGYLRNPIESFYWDIGEHPNIKIFNNGYSTAQIENKQEA